MKHKAICDLYPNVKNVIEDADGNLTALDENENEVVITDMSAVETKATELQTAKDNKAQEQADLKASAKTKLMNGEALTEDEANVMVGL